MRWWGRVFSRFTLVSLAILAQLFWMFFFIHRLSDHYMIVAAAFNFVTLIAAVIIVNKNGNPMVKMAWIVPILVFPLFGGILYFLSGGNCAVRWKQAGRGSRRFLSAMLRRTIS